MIDHIGTPADWFRPSPWPVASAAPAANSICSAGFGSSVRPTGDTNRGSDRYGAKRHEDQVCYLDGDRQPHAFQNDEKFIGGSADETLRHGRFDDAARSEWPSPLTSACRLRCVPASFAI